MNVLPVCFAVYFCTRSIEIEKINVMSCSSDEWVNTGKYGKSCFMRNFNNDDDAQTGGKFSLIHKRNNASDA